MKKRVILILFILLFSINLFAVNQQKTYLISDPVWQRTDRLCRMVGVLGPSPVSPTTGAEIKQALNRLNYENLNQFQKSEYDSIMVELDSSLGSFTVKKGVVELDPSLTLALQLYGFSPLKTTYLNEFFIPYNNREPFMNLQWDVYFSDYLYLTGQFLYTDTPTGFPTSGPDARKYFYNFSNMSFLMAPKYDGGFEFPFFTGGDHPTSSYHPFKAGASIGTSYMNFFVGRIKQEWGNGVVGNLIIGDNFSYQEIMKLSAFSDIVSYYFSLTHYDNIEDRTAFRFDGLHQTRSLQRLDFNIFNKARFVLNIGAHIVSENAFDWRMFMPMMQAHSWNNNREDEKIYPGDETNNILGFEIEWAIIKGLFASLQIVIDQFQLPVEHGSTVPSANGFMFNVKYTNPMKNGVLDSFFEFYYSNPYLYLNYKYFEDEDGNKKDCYLFDHIAGYYYKGGGGEYNYLGHIWGPDTIGFSAGTKYYSNNEWSIGGNLQFKVHGSKGLNSGYLGGEIDINNNRGEQENTPTGIPEYTFEVDIDGNYKITKTLDFTAAAALINKWNYHNVKNSYKCMIQGAVGIKWVAF